MNRLTIRPRFNLEVTMPEDELIKNISDEVRSCNGKCEVNLLKNHIVIKIPEEMQHFWSPELFIEIENTDGKTVLNCILGPKSAIWTLFATFYAVSVFTGLIGLVLGFSQWSLGLTPYGFWLVPLSIGLISLAYIIAVTGQKLSYDEMVFLRMKLNRALKIEKQ